jgi:uncharacterized membrane protein YeaQ/YmgE (transglycosylase-associated protein family)
MDGCLEGLWVAVVSNHGPWCASPDALGDNMASNSNISSDMHVDLAALLGAVVVVLLTFTFQPGAWGPISTIIGLWILCLLFGFFWGQRPTGRSHIVDWAVLGAAALVVVWTLFRKPGFDIVIAVSLWTLAVLAALPRRPRKTGSVFVGFVLAVVVGFVGAITFAQLVQWRWFRDDTGFSNCRPVAVAQATTAVRDMSDVERDKKRLNHLVNAALLKGSTEDAGIGGDNLGVAFYGAYEAAVGDCLAGQTFDILWWIGIPFSILTLAWWNLDSRAMSTASHTLGHRILLGRRGLKGSHDKPMPTSGDKD